MNLSCSNQDPCPVILDSKCVIYEGENLLYIGVNTNDNLRIALQKINETIQNLVLTGAGITQLVGDVIAMGPGVTSATLATVNANVGQFGSSTAIPKITVDGKGRITAISTDPVFIPSGALDFYGDVSGSGTTGASVELTLDTVNTNVYNANTFLKFAVNNKGLVTSATPVGSSDITTALGYTPAPSGNYITGLTGEATASGPGVANVTLSDAAVVAKVLTGLNITGGSVVDTDSLLIAIGKIQNQLNALYGGTQYQGVWNASTNTPALASGVGTKGHYYIVNVPGTTNLDGITDWNLGDWAIFDGTAWQQVDNTDAVVSVNGQTGAVSLTTDNIPEGALNQYYTALRARQAISLTTTGSTGAATYDDVTGVLNIPNYTSALTGYVPYTGATTNVNLGTYGLISDYLQLNNAPTSIPTTAGTMAWNDSYGTLDIKLKRGNVTLQVGQENVVPVINKTGSDLLEANYQAVRIRTTAEGGAQGQRLAVVLAQGNNDHNSATTIGLVTETINNNQEGFVTVFGNVNDINTTGSLQGETWADGDMIFLSPTTPGALTNVKPVAPQHLIVIGYVVYAHANHGIIFVKVDNGYELEELHNVKINGVVNNDGLFYNAATALWVNKSITTALGYTPVPTTRTLTINGTSYDLSADRSWTISTGVTSFNSRTGAVTLASGDVTSALGYTPYNSSNPAGYVTGSGSVNYATTAGTANAVAWGNVSSKPSNLAYWDTWYGSAYLGSNGDYYMGWAGVWTSSWLNQNVKSNASPTFNDVYANGWFRNYGDTGLYNQDYGCHFRRNASSSYTPWEVFGYSKGGYTGILFTDPQGYQNHLMFENGQGGIYVPNGSGWSFYYSRLNNCIGLGSSTTVNWARVRVDGTLYVTGEVYADGNVTAYSDARVKENVITVDNAIDKVLRMRGVYYNRIDDADKIRNIGVIAQELNDVVPEAVSYIKSADKYQVAYGNLGGLFIEAFKEQQSRIDKQDEIIKKLKSIINELTM